MEITKSDAHNILIFLERTSLSGSEVPAFIEVVNKLRKIESGEKKLFK